MKTGGGKYILDGHTPIVVGEPNFMDERPDYLGSPQWQEDLMRWGRFMENHGARTVGERRYWVSSLFVDLYRKARDRSKNAVSKWIGI